VKLIASWILALWLTAVLLGSVFELEPNAIDLNAVLSPPNQQHWLGTDELGRDILARVLSGVKASVLVACVVTVVTMFIGITVGVLAGFFGGRLDKLLMQITEIVMAFPGILLAIAFAAVLGPGIDNLILALSLTGWVSYARLVRGQTLSLKQRQHVQAAVSLGAGVPRLLFQHILPLTTSILVVEAAYNLASVMIAEASLSFLGLGIQAPHASWGGMLRDAVRFMLVAPHYVLIVGLCLMSLILAINLGSDYLRDRWDVRKENT
jgi:peptide/nickel transport system permease protein